VGDQIEDEVADAYMKHMQLEEDDNAVEKKVKMH
jgi:hypothetical protein